MMYENTIGFSSTRLVLFVKSVFKNFIVQKIIKKLDKEVQAAKASTLTNDSCQHSRVILTKKT